MFGHWGLESEEGNRQIGRTISSVVGSASNPIANSFAISVFDSDNNQKTQRKGVVARYV